MTPLALAAITLLSTALSAVLAAVAAAALFVSLGSTEPPTADPRLADLAAWHYEARGTFHHAPAQSTKEPAP